MKKNKIFIITIIISIIYSFNLNAQLSLYYPFNHSFIQDSCIQFKWNPDETETTYQFQISNDSTFSTLTTNFLITKTDTLINLNKNAKYFWRVKTLNTDKWFSFCFYIIDIKSFTNTIAWYISDSLINLNDSDSVSFWNDESGNNFNLEQNLDVKKPIFKSCGDTINNHNIIHFDGINDFIITSFGQTFAQPVNHFIFFRPQNIEGDIFDGGSIAEHLARFQYGQFINPFAGSYIQGTHPLTPNQFLLFNIEFNSPNSISYINKEIDAQGNNGYNGLSGLQLGSLANGGNNTKMDVAEYLIINDSLTDSLRTIIQNYFFWKYSPPVDLGLDVYIPYGFCDTILNAGGRFKSYLWNTGDTTATLSVNKSGTYSVTVTDIFGFNSSDTLKVIFPGNLNLTDTDTTICYGDTLFWSTRLNHNYTFEWQDGSSEPFYNISTEGAYSVTITDTLGCQFKTDTAHILVDMLPNTNLLDENESICAGMNLTILNESDETLTYEWSTGSTDESILVETEGEYSVIITNELGCMAKDTTNISINGQVPTPGFKVENNCFTNLTTFIDTSIVYNQDNITEWYWELGDGQNSSVQNPSYIYSDTGDYMINLRIVTNNNCEMTIEKTIRIYSLPKASFKLNNALCQNYLINFVNESSSTMGDIDNVTWLFDDGTESNDISVQKSFNNFGSHNVSLTIESTYGCKNTIDSNITIKPTPVADFNHTETCVNRNIHFDDISNIDNNFGISSWYWTSSDEQSSTKSSADFFFNSTGEKEVQLLITAVNECQDSIAKTININSNPSADFIVDTICQNTQSLILNNSSDTTNMINGYYWWLDNNLISTEIEPSLTIEDTGVHHLLLKVVSEALCYDTISKYFNAKPLPISTFTSSVYYTTSGIPINFTADVIDSTNSYLFAFGDSTTANTAKIAHLYSENGDYTVSLKVQNQWACNTTSFEEVSIVVPLMDIQIDQANLIEKDGKYQFEVLISNVGNLDVNAINFGFKIDDRFLFEEISQTELLIRDSKKITLATQLLDKPDYFCINILPEGPYSDIILDNNIICVNIDNMKNVLSIYPNPVKSEYHLLHYSNKDRTVTIEINNMLGQRINTFDLNLKEGLHNYTINSKYLSNGQYLFKIDNKVIKFIKE